MPLVELFEGLLTAAVESGAVHPGLETRRAAGAILEATMFNAFSQTIVGLGAPEAVDDDEALWDLILNGIGAGDRPV